MLLFILLILAVAATSTNATDTGSFPSDFRAPPTTGSGNAEHSVQHRIIIFFVLDKPTPFLEETITATTSLAVNRNRTRMEIYVLAAATDNKTRQLTTVRRVAFRHRHRLAEIAVFQSAVSPGLDRARDSCASWACDFLFYVEAHVHIRDRQLLAALTFYNRTIVAPFAATINHERNENGGAEKPEDYSNAKFHHNFRRTSQWSQTAMRPANHIRFVFLLRKDFFELVSVWKQQRGRRTDAASVVSRWSAAHSVPVITTAPLGINLIRRRAFLAAWTKRHIGELWQVFANPVEWEERYVHRSYHRARQQGQFEEPCPDVYWIPIFSPDFCRDLRDETEAFGLWSFGGNLPSNDSFEADARRTEVNLPYATVDIYMWQIDFNTEYMWILLKYLYPIQLMVFPQHDDYPYSIDNFVVRYQLGEQVKLASHFDESQITFNVALNNHGEDYAGGGTHFVRYNCSVVQTRQGWGILHPNRPTHRHLGLELISGIRYIVVSFLDGQKYIAENGKPIFDKS